MRLLLAAAGLSCLGQMAAARPYRIDDMLRLESYGQVLLAPDGRRVLVERRGRYDGASRFTYGYQTRRLQSRVMLTDMTTGSALVPAFPQEKGAGYWIGGFAPSGGRYTVFRLMDDRLRLGAADLDGRSVRWLAGAPDLPISSPAPAWRDATHVIYVRFIEERLPLVLDHAGIMQKTLPRRWRAAAYGKDPSADVATTSTSSRSVPREQRELVETDLVTGRERILAQGPLVEFVLSPRRDRVALISSGPAVRPDAGARIAAGYQAERRRLTVIDLASGRVTTPCAACDVAQRGVDFSADGDLLLRARSAGAPWSEAHLIVFTGKDRSDFGVAKPVVRTAWLGPSLLVGDGRWSCRLCGEALRAALAALPSDATLIAVDGAEAWFRSSRGIWRMDAAGNFALAYAGTVGRTGLDYLDPASTGVRDLLLPRLPVFRRSADASDELSFGASPRPLRTLAIAPGADVLAVSPSTGAAMGLVTDDHGVGTLTLWRSGRQPIAVDRISAHLTDVDLPVARPIARGGSDSAPLVDWLLLPRTTGPHPLVVIPYQGSVWTGALPAQARPEYFGSATNVMLLVASGYAVLLPSLPEGPAGKPQSTLVRDLEAAVDGAIGTGLIDPSRLALLGHSFGGVNALYLAANTSRFRAVVAASGASDLAASYGELPPAERVWMGAAVPLGDATAWFETGQGRLEGAPWEFPQRYVDASSLFSADRIRSPLLLVGGDLDYVPMEQAERLFVILNRLGRDVTLLRYFGEGHVLQSPANIRFNWRSILAFFARTVPPPRSEAASGAK